MKKLNYFIYLFLSAPMFARRKKLTAQDCKEIYEEFIHQGEEAAMDLCFRKGYHSPTTFY